MQVLIAKIGEIIREEWNTTCMCRTCMLHYTNAANSIIEQLTIDDLETIINEKRYEEKARRKMAEADARDL